MSAKILVVEDDRDIRKNVRQLLEMEGYVVEVAENGQVALDFLNRTATLPKFILLDLMMPVMDGFQFREQQKKDERLAKIPVAIMTADGHVDEKRLRIGAVEALKKPADVDAILEVVRRHCG